MASTKFRIGISRDCMTAAGTIFGEEAFEVLKDPAVEWEFMPEKVAEIPPQYASKYDAICLMTAKVTRGTLSPADRKLKLVARFGVGYDSVDVAACTDNGVLLTISPDGVRRPVAASVMGFVLALAHRMFLKDRLTREGRWAEKGNYLGSGLMGRTLGVVGVGNIGKEIFRLVQPFGMKLLGCDPNVPQSAVASLGVTMVDLNALLRQSDYVSINTLLDESTRGLIGAKEFALMKPSAYFINTARGPVVVESALIDALRNNRIAGAAIDVFEQEPVPPDNPLLKMDNVIVAPHAICHTDECMSLLGKSAFKAAVDLAHGRKPHLIVDTEALRHPQWVGKFHA
ncbi:MAG TPA: NAD(P)-dependent oxidoreductase [Burkholderiales bacterium]|nr:NAD(P)-dependent oxidoreductase [Burkholderiales bacterium]